MLPDEGCTHLLARHDRRPASRDFVAVRRTIRELRYVTRDGLLVCSLPAAVVDACRSMVQLREVRALVAEAVQTRRTTPALLAAEVAAGESAGSRLIRAALVEIGLGARSAPEAEVVSAVRRSTLPEARWNPSLLTPDGLFLACPDGWWAAANTVLEIDSIEWHLSPEHWAATMARRERMTRQGLLVVAITPGQSATAGTVLACPGSPGIGPQGQRRARRCRSTSMAMGSSDTITMTATTGSRYWSMPGTREPSV